MAISRHRRVDIVCVALTLSALLTAIALYAAYFFLPVVFKALSNMRLESSLILPVTWMVLFTYLATVSVGSYLRSVMTDPGAVPFEFSYEAMAEDDEFNVASRLLLTPSRPILRRVADETSNACDPCQLFKPQRTHHCSRCERCVLKYDHHCPWMGNCVGFYNYKFYLQFIVSTWLFAWVANLTLFGPAAHSAAWILGADVSPVPGCGERIHYAQYVHEARANLPPRDFLSARIAPIPANWDAGVCGLWMLPLFALGLFTQLWLGFLVNRHQWLLRNNMTTVELVQYGQVKKGSWRYDAGSWRANLVAVFGKRARLRDYLFPTTPQLYVEDAVCAYAPVEVDSDDDIFADAKKWLEPMRRLSFSTPSYGATDTRRSAADGRERRRASSRSSTPPPAARPQVAVVSPMPSPRAENTGSEQGVDDARARAPASNGTGDGPVETHSTSIERLVTVSTAVDQKIALADRSLECAMQHAEEPSAPQPSAATHEAAAELSSGAAGVDRLADDIMTPSTTLSGNGASPSEEAPAPSVDEAAADAPNAKASKGRRGRRGKK